MARQHAVVVTLLVAAIAAPGACNPYNNSGEFNAGPVDSSGFPAPYLPANSRKNQAGSGSFVESAAFINGNQTGYFRLALTPSQLAPAPATPPGGCPTAATDPLRLVDSGKPYAALPTPKAYRFTDSCTPPAGYQYDDGRDDLRYDQQGNIFTALPTATYVPIVRENVVSAGGLDCQSIKSEKLLLKKLMPSATGAWLFWAVIDPGAGVYRFNDPNATNPMQVGGVGVQSYGWYQQYYLAYLDGGTVPTVDVMVTEPAGGPMPCMPVTKPVTRIQTQKLYYPIGMIGVPQPDGTVKMVAGALGGGFDVLEAGRDDAGYSPVCAVNSFMPTAAGGGPPMVSDLPTSAADVVARFGATVKPGMPALIYCPQVK